MPEQKEQYRDPGPCGFRIYEVRDKCTQTEHIPPSEGDNIGTNKHKGYLKIETEGKEPLKLRRTQSCEARLDYGASHEGAVTKVAFKEEEIKCGSLEETGSAEIADPGDQMEDRWSILLTMEV